MSPWLALAQPNLPLKRLLRRWPRWSVANKLKLDIYPRPYYAYGIHRACVLAKALGHEAVSILEFGVAGGAGLVMLEQIGQEVGDYVGVRTEVFGFDTGEGLPSAGDPRDLPYVWQRGFYRMDQAALRAKLQRAKLVIGPVEETVKIFLDTHQPPPVGFISFDLDFYTSTVAAMTLFDESRHEAFLPRVLCYLDDIIGKDEELHGQHVGELAAVEHFNATHEQQKISLLHGLRHKRIFQSGWCDQMFVLNRFDHPQYNTYVSPTADKQLPIRG